MYQFFKPFSPIASVCNTLSVATSTLAPPYRSPASNNVLKWKIG